MSKGEWHAVSRDRRRQRSHPPAACAVALSCSILTLLFISPLIYML